MALNAYLTLTGQKQGLIQGSVTQKGREGKIMVIAVTHEIVCPRDPASGHPTGKRMHKPFSISKEIDRSSPLLESALCNNENIVTWRLDFWTPGRDGLEKQNYTVKLTNATVSSIATKMANNKNPKLVGFAPYEEIAFTYQKIEWTWNEGGIMAADDWEAPRY
jgi:type VI secretion system secreted protein Hcp